MVNTCKQVMIGFSFTFHWPGESCQPIGEQTQTGAQNYFRHSIENQANLLKTYQDVDTRDPVVNSNRLPKCDVTNI